jgi:hypothetical protein
MAVTLSDEEIERLIGTTKPLSDDYQVRMQTRAKRGHKESELDIRGEDSGDFRLLLRQSLFNPLDFSIILAYRPPKSNQLFRLMRYNGKSHEHTNTIEHETFYNYHIHLATQRYQEVGAREDSYAKATDRYADFHQAIACMLADCQFELPPNLQGRLFDEG